MPPKTATQKVEKKEKGFCGVKGLTEDMLIAAAEDLNASIGLDPAIDGPDRQAALAQADVAAPRAALEDHRLGAEGARRVAAAMTAL